MKQSWKESVHILMHVRVATAELQSLVASKKRQQWRYVFAIRRETCCVVNKACHSETDAARQVLYQIFWSIDLFQFQFDSSQKLDSESLLKSIKAPVETKFMLFPWFYGPMSGVRF